MTPSLSFLSSHSEGKGVDRSSPSHNEVRCHALGAAGEWEAGSAAGVGGTELRALSHGAFASADVQARETSFAFTAIIHQPLTHRRVQPRILSHKGDCIARLSNIRFVFS